MKIEVQPTQLKLKTSKHRRNRRKIPDVNYFLALTRLFGALTVLFMKGGCLTTTKIVFLWLMHHLKVNHPNF
jgi:hypothetical protein